MKIIVRYHNLLASSPPPSQQLLENLFLLIFQTRHIFSVITMPNIVYDVKLDFKDVLLRPKRSTLKSRADVDLYREIVFRNSKQTYNGIPIMASNMDTVGTFEMARTLSKVIQFT